MRNSPLLGLSRCNHCQSNHCQSNQICRHSPSGFSGWGSYPSEYLLGLKKSVCSAGLSEKAGVYSCTVRTVTNGGAGIRAQDLKVVPLDFALSLDMGCL